MDDMISGLEALGLGGLDQLDLFGNAEEKKKKARAAAGEKVQKEKTEMDIIFDKTYNCPICDNEFKVKAVKTGKARLIRTDSDLRPVYEFDTLKYDAIVCPKCGYASLTRYVANVSDAGIKAVKAKISASFKGITEPAETYSYDDALIRHQMALMNTMVRPAKNSEKAYICLKIAWLHRGKAEQLEAQGASKAEIDKLHAVENGFLAKAYEGFTDSMSKEQFPIAGMDEAMLTLLLADLARRSGDMTSCKRYISQVITMPSAPSKVKDKARELKDMVLEMEKKAKA